MSVKGGYILKFEDDKSYHMYLISANEVNHYKSIGKVNKPIRLIKPNQKISWCAATKGCISRQSATEVEKCNDNY